MVWVRSGVTPYNQLMDSVQATVMAVLPVGEMLKPVPLLLDAVTVKVTGVVLAPVAVEVCV
jgi:hypothetical protein